MEPAAVPDALGGLWQDGLERTNLGPDSGMMVGVALLITKEECNRWYMLLLAVVAIALMDVNILDLLLF